MPIKEREESMLTMTERRRLPKMENTCVSAAGETHHGGRENNQDVFIVDANLGLFAVLDGMGGHAAGDVAAQMASDALIAFISRYATSGRFAPRELLEFAIDHAATVVHRAARRHSKWAGMGTTAVACLVIDSNRVIIGHAGDSRAYLLRGGCLRALTRDHTIVQQLVDDGQLSPEDAAQSPVRNILTRNLGDKDGVQAEMLELAIESEDRIMLCSDGLYGCLPSNDLERVLRMSPGPEQAAHALIEAALTSGTVSDNISAVVLDVPPR